MKQNKYSEQAHEDRMVGLRFLPKLVNSFKNCACFKVQRYPTSDLCKSFSKCSISALNLANLKS